MSPEIDAAPHATPDQIRAAEKRAAAAAAARSEDSDASEESQRRAAPKGRRSVASETA
jgi:hypothetical protein